MKRVEVFLILMLFIAYIIKQPKFIFWVASYSRVEASYASMSVTKLGKK